jgi:hypothetical protein
MTAGINHIISEAMVREQLNKGGATPITTNNNSISTPTKKDCMTQYQSPSKRLLKGLTTTCDGSYGQQLLPIPSSMDTVPVEDIMRWKEFRRKQKKTAAAAATTEIDVDGFPFSDDDSHDDNYDDGTIPKQRTSNSEVGTEIAANTARYLAKQSNIMARQLMMSSNEEEGEEDDDDWGPPLDVGDDWCSPLDVGGGKDDEIKISEEEEDCETANNNADSHINDDGMSPSSQSRQPSQQQEVPKKDVPTMDEVHNFMNQLKQKSAAGRVSSKYYSKGSDNNTISMNNSSRRSSSSPPKSTPQRSSPAQQPVVNGGGSHTKPPTTSTATSSSDEVHKSLTEHRERMRQQKLEGERKRQEFDARLQLLRSKLHGEAVVHAGGNGAADGGLIVPTMEDDSIQVAPPHIEQGEKEVRENDEQKSVPILPGARWSGGLAVWSPSNGGGGGSSSAAKRSKSTPPKLSSPSRQDHNVPQQQQQKQSTPLQLLPPMGIGIDEDDFSFSPVDVEAVLGKSSGSSSLPEEMEQPSSESFELFTVTKSSEAYGDEMLTEGNIDNVDPEDVVTTTRASKAPSRASSNDVIISAQLMGSYSNPQSQIAKRPPKSPPSDVSPPISNDSTDITEGDKGGGLGSGYVRGFGGKSMASSVQVELGIVGVDPPLDDESSEKEEESLLGVTVVGSKRRKRKSSSPRTACETVEEQGKDGLKEDASVNSMEDEHRRDPSPVAFEPTARDAPPVRKQLDPDGIVWNDINTVKTEAHSTESTTPSGSEKKTIDADLEEIDTDQVCPDNIFSPRNNNLPPVTPRMTPQAKDGQWNPGNHFTPRSKLLTTPRATPRTVRAANLSSNRKFGFGLEDDSTDTSFKMNEKPLARRDNKVDEVSDEPSKGTSWRSEMHRPNKDSYSQQRNAGNSTPSSKFPQKRDHTPRSHRSSEMDANFADEELVDGDESEAEQIKDQNEGRSPKSFNKHTAIKNIRSKFESNTFGMDHLQKSLQNIREEKAVGACKSPIKTTFLDSPIEDSNTPSKIYLVDRDLRAMSSLEIDTQPSLDYSLNKGVSEDNEATIGDNTLDGTMDTRKALRYARKLEKLNENEDNSKENHDEEATSSIVALRRKAFENQASESIKLETVGSQKDKGSLASQRSLFNASNRHEPKSREEARQVHKSSSQNHSSVTLTSPSGKTGVVASIKERIAAYDVQNSKNGKPSPYRLSSQSKTFQVRVGGQVKNINIQNSARRPSTNETASLQKANPVTKTSLYTAGADVDKEGFSPSWAMNQNKQLSPAPAGITIDSHKVQYGGAYSSKNEPPSYHSQATGSQYHPAMSRVTPIDTRYESHTPDDGDDDGITLSPTISEVSGLTLPTCLTSVVPVPEVNEYERSMTPISRLRHKMHQANRFSYDHTDAPTPRTSMETSSHINQQGSSRRDQIVSRIRETSSNGNLWQRRNVVTEVSNSTSGDASSKSQKATMCYPSSKSASQGMVAEKVAKIDRPTRVNGSGERVSVVNRVAMMNRHSQQHTKRPSMARNSMSDEPSSSLATRDCIRVD